jgi:hypothetical protein
MIRVTVGEVELRWDGEVTLRQVRLLLREAAGIAVALGQSEDAEPETKATISLGFTTEVAAYEEPDLSEWFEESP